MFANYFGDPGLINQQTERYRAVTAADVNGFVSERLKPDNRAVLLYVPRTTKASAEGEPVMAVQS
jgi:predicted Zn-dependent peptidase